MFVTVDIRLAPFTGSHCHSRVSSIDDMGYMTTVPHHCTAHSDDGYVDMDQKNNRGLSTFFSLLFQNLCNFYLLFAIGNSQVTLFKKCCCYFFTLILYCPFYYSGKGVPGFSDNFRFLYLCVILYYK